PALRSSPRRRPTTRAPAGRYRSAHVVGRGSWHPETRETLHPADGPAPWTPRGGSGRRQDSPASRGSRPSSAAKRVPHRGSLEPVQPGGSPWRRLFPLRTCLGRGPSRRATLGGTGRQPSPPSPPKCPPHPAILEPPPRRCHREPSLVPRG